MIVLAAPALSFHNNHTLGVIAGLVPAIPLRDAPCQPNRDGRDKPGQARP